MSDQINSSKKRSHDQIFTNDLVGKCRSAHDFYILLTEQCKFPLLINLLYVIYSLILPSEVHRFKS